MNGSSNVEDILRCGCDLEATKRSVTKDGKCVTIHVILTPSISQTFDFDNDPFFHITRSE